jgi:hypothetical protein
MSDIKILRLALSDSGADAAAGVNLTNAEVVAKVEVGPYALDPKGGKCPWGICHDWSGNIYMSDSVAHVILKIEEGGRVSTVAGKKTTAGNNGTQQNVKATDARFRSPRGICCDKSGTLYVADAGNHQIRTIKGGLVNVLAGSGLANAGGNGFVDGSAITVGGVGTQAKFDTPVDVAVDKSGTVYVSDNTNHAIRKIKANTVTTIAGNGNAGDKENLVPTAGNGATYPAHNACLNAPWEICCDPSGNIYIVDYSNYKVKKLTPNGALYLFSGSGASGRSLGAQNVTLGTSKANTCSYHYLWDIDNDESGNVYVLSVTAANQYYQGSRLIKIDYEGTPSVIAEFGGATINPQVISVICTPGQKIFVATYEA